MSKVLLVYPNFIAKEGALPLGIAYLAAVLRQAKINFEILDTNFSQDWQEVRRVLKKTKPSIVAISFLSSMAKDAFRVAKLLKKLAPDALVVMGGPHPTIFPKETVENPYIDFVLMGESERSFLKLIKAIEKKDSFKKIPGLVFKKGRKIIVNDKIDFVENLDSLLFPARDAFPTLGQYLKLRRSVTVMASRGCPFNCSFCQPTLRKIFGPRVRFRSPKNVIAELEEIKKLGFKEVVFEDDTLTAKKEWIRKLCQLMIKKRLNLAWSCNSRVNLIEKETLKLMKKAGLKRIAFGVESGSQRVLDEVMQKGIKVEETVKAFDLCRRLGIKTVAFVMLGSPTETKEEIKETIKLVKKIKPDWISVTRTVLLPHTHLWDFAHQKRLVRVKENNFNKFHYADFNSKTHKIELSEKELHQAKNKLFFTWGITNFWQQPVKKSAAIVFSILASLSPKVARMLGRLLSNYFWVPPPLYT